MTARTAIEHDGKPIRFCNNTNLQQALRPVRLEPSSLKMNCSITDYSQRIEIKMSEFGLGAFASQYICSEKYGHQ